MPEHKNPAAVALGRLGGKVKGVKGLAAMSAEDRRRIAMKGVAARKKNRRAKKRLQNKAKP